jgi:hypothetical protein
LGNILDAKTKVLFAFDTLENAIDLDPEGSFCKRKIAVTYLSKRVVLEPFAQKIKAKIAV